MWRVIACLALAACERVGAPGPIGAILVEDEEPPPSEARGVSPFDFQCASVAPLDDVAGAIGVAVLEDRPSVPTIESGAPTCRYIAADPSGPAAWGFDIDCRPGALDAGEQAMVDLAVGPGAIPLRVGRSGVDDDVGVLLFIDDDAPCAVRVFGPRAAGRVALARLIAARLAPRTAPGKVSPH